jgi:hypothetical protein
MELVLIAFIGTLALIFAELRDAGRRRHNASVTAPTSPAVSGPSGRTMLQYPVAADAESYSEAA